MQNMTECQSYIILLIGASEIAQSQRLEIWVAVQTGDDWSRNPRINKHLFLSFDVQILQACVGPKRLGYPFAIGIGMIKVNRQVPQRRHGAQYVGKDC